MMEDPGADLPDESETPVVPTANERIAVWAERTDISKREMMGANWAELQTVARVHDLPCRKATIISMPDIVQARKMVWDHYARKYALAEDREGLDRFSLPVLNHFVTKNNLAVVPRMVQGTTQLTLLRDEIWAAYENGIKMHWIEGAHLDPTMGVTFGSEAQPGDREDEHWVFVVSDSSNDILLISSNAHEVQRLKKGAFGKDMKVSYELWRKA